MSQFYLTVNLLCVTKCQNVKFNLYELQLCVITNMCKECIKKITKKFIIFNFFIYILQFISSNLYLSTIKELIGQNERNENLIIRE